MRNLKMTMSLWIIAGICFLLTTILMLINKIEFSLILLNMVVTILSFINAYIEYKKELK